MDPDPAAVGQLHQGQKTLMTLQKTGRDQGRGKTHWDEWLGKSLKGVPDPDPVLQTVAAMLPVAGFHLALHEEAPAPQVVFEAGTQAHDRVAEGPRQGEVVIGIGAVQVARSDPPEVGQEAVIHGVLHQQGRFAALLGLHGAGSRL